MKNFTLLLVFCFIIFSCSSKKGVQIEQKVNVIREPSINMVRINSGVFLEQVSVDSFYLSVFLVTQKIYEKTMGTNPSFFKGENLPVENISWREAIEFCNRLSLQDGLTPVYTIVDNVVTWNREANGYRLPTDIEWEFACRAGTTTPFNTGNNISSNQANYDARYPFNSNIRGEYRAKTTPVGMFSANAWGLYDMHGNVWEWCWDDPHSKEPDSSVLNASSVRVIRGGAWSSSGRSLHSSFRSGFQPHWKNNYLGFRVARNVE